MSDLTSRGSVELYRDTYIERRLDDFEEASRSNLFPLVDDDLRIFALELARYAARALSLAELQAVLAQTQHVDLKMVDRVRRILKDAHRDPAVEAEFAKAGQDTAGWNDALDEIYAELESSQHRATPFELRLFIETLGDKRFGDVHIAVDGDKALDALVEVIAEKLELLSAEQLALLWQRIVNEFEGTGFGVRMLPRLEYDPAIMGPDFLNPPPDRTLKESIARYLGKLRPRTIAKMILSGQSTFPANVPGVLTVATWIGKDATRRLSIAEQGIIGAVARLSVLWRKKFGDSFPEFASLLELEPKGPVLSGSIARQFERQFDAQKTRRRRPIQRAQ